MAISGYTDVRVTSWNTLRFSWNVTSQSIENNSSVFVWSLQLISTGSGAINSTTSKSWVVKVYGNTYSGTNTIGTASNSTKNLANGITIISHKLDGTRTVDYQFSQEFDITFSNSHIGTLSGSGIAELNPIHRKANITSAPNFNDEDNPTITYNVLGYDVTLAACISFNGSNDDIPYREISKTAGTYTFNLTEAERETLRQATLDSKGRSIMFYLRTTFPNGTIEYSYVTRTLTIVNAAPVINPTFVDTNSETLALTNNGNYIVKGYSNMAYNFKAVPKKGATITSYKVTCGSKVGTSSSGIITGADGGAAVFVATDSRGYSTTVTITKSLINYIKLSCVIYDEWLSPSGELTFNVKGNFFDGSFGLSQNMLELRYRSMGLNGENTNWQDAMPILNGDNTYSFTGKITGLDYTKSYLVRVAARDTLQTKLSGVEWTVVDTNYITSTPVFDWSRTDFNINVPTSVPSLTVGGNPVRGMANNKVLWSGNSHMNGSQIITLSEPISDQPSGIVLVFSTYDNTYNIANDSSFNTFFISKKQVELFPDCGHTFILGINAGFSGMAAKYLTFRDKNISGHSGNTSSGTNSGITYDNSRYVLRYVIGV
jgi:hypothetical protein